MIKDIALPDVITMKNWVTFAPHKQGASAISIPMAAIDPWYYQPILDQGSIYAKADRLTRQAIYPWVAIESFERSGDAYVLIVELLQEAGLLRKNDEQE